MSRPRNHGKPWTPAARTLLLDAWTKTGRISAVALYVGRTEVAVMSELGRLLSGPLYVFRDACQGGGRRVSAEPTPRPAEAGQRWTSDEDGVLRELAGWEAPEEIADRLDRSVGAVYSRMRHLGLDPTKPTVEMCEQDWLQLEDWMGVTLPDWRDVAPQASLP